MEKARVEKTRAFLPSAVTIRRDQWSRTGSAAGGSADACVAAVVPAFRTVASVSGGPVPHQARASAMVDCQYETPIESSTYTPFAGRDGRAAPAPSLKETSRDLAV